MDRTELAWAAGFWDGEGSAWLTRPQGRAIWSPQARINQSSTTGMPQVLVRFRAAVGLGQIKGPELKDGKEPLYRWVVSSRGEIFEVARLITPWLGPVKSHQFARVLGTTLGRPESQFGGREEELAWAAGFFDGEGSVYLDKHQTHAGYFRLEAAITQSDPTGSPFVLRRYERVVAIGKIYGPHPAPPGHDPVYRWKAHRADQIIAMVDLLRPWLGDVKRAQADRCIAVIRAQSPLPRGNPAWGNRKTHCVHGHEYASARIRPFRGRGKNTEAPRASHQCLACVRDLARRERNERKKKSRGVNPRLF